MRKWLLLFLAVVALVGAEPLVERKAVDSAALSQLTKELGLDTPEGLVAATQKEWLRPAGKKRWEMAELSADKKQLVLAWAEKSGLFSEWKPACKSYENAVILGATIPVMQARLDYLVKLWNEGVRFERVVWLTGARPLDKSADGVIEDAKDEFEAALLLWKNSKIPEEMRKLPLVSIGVAMKGPNEDIQPNTKDTIEAWMEDSFCDGAELYISSQPFCGYQFAVVEATLGKRNPFDMAGPGVDPSIHPAAAEITLDALARWLYQEELNQK